MLPMIWFLVFLLFVLIMVPFAWLASEFQPRVWLRIALGVLALGMSYCVASLVGLLTAFNYNAWYGSACMKLIETVITNVEAGNTTVLLEELNRLREEYQPTYENKAGYDTLVDDFVDRMHAAQPQSGTNGDEEPPE